MKRHTSHVHRLLTALFLMFAMASYAQKPICLALWPDGAPNDNGLSGDEIIGEELKTRNVSRPSLYVFPAEKPNGMAIVCCPGGAYYLLSMDHEGLRMADWLNAQGITYAVLKYRMPNGHKDVPLSDAEQAMRLMREHANEWGVNPQLVGIMGSSAGGHLAASLATLYTSEATRPDFQVLFYPVITMGEGTHEGSRDNLLGPDAPADLREAYSLETRVTPATPPAFIMFSSDDSLVPVAYNAIPYYIALLKNGVPAALHAYPTGEHGWGFYDSFPHKRQWTGELEHWLHELTPTE